MNRNDKSNPIERSISLSSSFLSEKKKKEKDWTIIEKEKDEEKEEEEEEFEKVQKDRSPGYRYEFVRIDSASRFGPA